MTIFSTQTVDLAMSHSQIVLCDTTTYNPARWDWGKLNVEQGAVLHPDSLTFDPLPDVAFGAFVHLRTADRFELNAHAKRAIVAPFVVKRPDALEIGSVPTQYPLDLAITRGLYHVYFEICEDYTKDMDADDKLFYQFTLIKQPEPSRSLMRPRYLLDDNWGGEKGKELVIGKADRPFTMTLGRMQRYLRSLGISKNDYQILTNLPEAERENIKKSMGWHNGGCDCIAHDVEPGEGWSVFYAERGERFAIQTFTDEADACYGLIYR